jgi:hypothetical protein
MGDFRDATDDPAVCREKLTLGGYRVGYKTQLVGMWEDKADLIVKRMRQIGIKRILYGSDAATPDNLPKEALERWHLLPLTKDELRSIENNVAPYLGNWRAMGAPTMGALPDNLRRYRTSIAWIYVEPILCSLTLEETCNGSSTLKLNYHERAAVCSSVQPRQCLIGTRNLPHLQIRASGEWIIASGRSFLS